MITENSVQTKKLTSEAINNTFRLWPIQRENLNARHCNPRASTAVELLGDILMSAIATSPKLPKRSQALARKAMQVIQAPSEVSHVRRPSMEPHLLH